MSSITLEKRATEVIPAAGDFGVIMAATGDGVISANADAKAFDLLTDQDVTGDIIVSGSLDVDGNVITCSLQNGVAGTAYRIVLYTGITDLGFQYDTDLTLLVTDRPATDDVLCSLTEVKRKLRLTDNSDDILLTDLILAASEYFRRRTGRQYHVAPYTDFVDLDLDETRNEIQLSQWPVLKLEEAVRLWSDGTVETIDLASIIFSPEGWCQLTDGSIWMRYPGRNRIKFRAGYVRLPDDIREAVKGIVIHTYRLITREGLTQERIGDYMYQRKNLNQFPSGEHFELADEFIEAVVQRYKRRDLEF